MGHDEHEVDVGVGGGATVGVGAEEDDFCRAELSNDVVDELLDVGA